MLQADDRPQAAAAGRLPGVIEWMFGCSFHERPVRVAGRFPGAAEVQPVQEDCRCSELRNWTLEATGRGHLADC